MYALLRVFILLCLSTIMVGCIPKTSTQRHQASMPLEFKTIENDTPSTTLKDNEGYATIRFEYLNYSTTESGFFRKFLLQQNKNILITGSIHANDKEYTLPILYLETRDAENLTKFQNQQGRWLLPKTFIDREGEVLIGFKWTEVEDSDSGYIIEAIDQVGSLGAIFQPATMTAINSAASIIDKILKKYSNSTYNLKSSTGYTINELNTISKIILFRGDKDLSFENSLKGLPSTILDYQSTSISSRSPNDYLMLSCKTTDSCFTDGNVSESPFYKNISPVVDGIIHYPDLSGKTSYFKQSIVPAIKKLNLSPKDESAFKVYIANIYGLWAGDHNISEDDIERAATLNVERALPVQSLAYEFMNEWINGDIGDDYVTNRTINIVRDNTEFSDVFTNDSVILGHLYTLEVKPSNNAMSFDASNSYQIAKQSVTFNALIRSAGGEFKPYRVTITIRKNKVRSISFRRLEQSV